MRVDECGHRQDATQPQPSYIRVFFRVSSYGFVALLILVRSLGAPDLWILLLAILPASDTSASSRNFRSRPVSNTSSQISRCLEGQDPIRLIELQPSSSITDVVQCRLVHSSLRQARDDIVASYTALSYVWGDHNDTTEVVLNNGILQITKTLDCALRHIRDELRVMYVWADGICINQSDKVERADQVLLMGEIYSTAHHTVIYLGPGDSTSRDVLSILQDCCNRGNYQYSSLSINFGLVEGLRQILNNPWFFRIWILQEFVLSRDSRVQWGQARCAWKALSDMVDYMSNARRPPDNSDSPRDHRQSTPGGGFPIDFRKDPDTRGSSNYNLKSRSGQAFTATEVEIIELLEPLVSPTSNFHVLGLPQHGVLERMQAAKIAHDHALNKDDENVPKDGRRHRRHKDRRRGQDLIKLLDLMVSRAGLGAFDPRDMVFAHLGLARNADIQVDYSKTVAEVYHDLARESITRFNSLRILGYVNDADPDDRGIMASSRGGIVTCTKEKLVSWTPNWTMPRKLLPYSIMEYVKYNFEAPSDTRRRNMATKAPSCYYSVGPSDLLTTDGWVFGTVKEIGPILENIPIILQRDESRGYLWPVVPSKEWLMDIPGLPAKVVEIMWRNYETKRVSLGDTDRHSAQSLVLHICQRRLITAEKSIIDARRIAIVDSERLALVPACANQGDLICFLDGCPVPFVVRETYVPDQSVIASLEAMKSFGGRKREILNVKLVGE
ncbi:uncharacterized protein PAC_18588 [Phialocephala subalpina]|uniref:Heterokaryon incompatibility domain-containing protein n=1 Tax=Phialocephala subalpina TaxID=576137 RepID=A0A1L7XUI7_9HELO|nr:uncharacterized protein PAC_18588 [Phialocephala subalpina]